MRYDILKFEKIRSLRIDKELSQSVLADYLGVTQTAYSKYELGQRNMTPEILLKLAEFHNTSVDYLLGITNTKDPYPRV